MLKRLIGSLFYGGSKEINNHNLMSYNYYNQPNQQPSNNNQYYTYDQNQAQPAYQNTYSDQNQPVHQNDYYDQQPVHQNDYYDQNQPAYQNTYYDQNQGYAQQPSYGGNQDYYQYDAPAQNYSNPQVLKSGLKSVAKGGYSGGGVGAGGLQDLLDDLVLDAKPAFIQQINPKDPFNQDTMVKILGGGLEDIDLRDYFDVGNQDEDYGSSEELSDEEEIPPPHDEQVNAIQSQEFANQYGDSIPINLKTKKIVAAHNPNNEEETYGIFDLVPDELAHKHMPIEQIRKSLGGSKYVDREFNLDTNIRDSQKFLSVDPDNIKWRQRGYTWTDLKTIESKIGTKFKIYDDKIHPNDVVQGELGSCFFLSAISALAERPALVRRLFEGPQLNPSGVQGVWLCHCGVWKQIAIDDFYPTSKYGQFAFASGRDGKLWVPMIEKAYAKAYGSYEAINGGRAEEALRELTGSPYEVYRDEMKKDTDKLWEKILDSDKKNYLMVTAKNNREGEGQTIDGKPEMKHNNGLISGHAYSLIAAHEVTGSDRRQHKIVQIRNPWGKGEWNGKWSDNSPLWTQELRNQLKQVDQDDGSFWMPFEDWCREYDDIGICKVHPNFVYNSLEKTITLDNETKTFPVLIHTRKEGTFYFSVDKENDKIHLENSSPYVRITIVKLTNDGVKWVGSTAAFEKNVNVKCKISAGTYLALVDISPQEYPSQSPKRKIVFSSYGEDIASLQEAKLTKKQMTEIEIMALNEWAVTDQKGAWKRNKQPQDLGSFKIYTDVLSDMNSGISFNRIVPSDPNAKLSMVLNVQVQNAAACDGSRDEESFKINVGNTGVFYGKVNDQSVRMSAGFKGGARGEPDSNYLGTVRGLLNNYKGYYPKNTVTGIIPEKPAPQPTPSQPAQNQYDQYGNVVNPLSGYINSGGYNNYRPAGSNANQQPKPSPVQPTPSNNNTNWYNDQQNNNNYGGWGQQADTNHGGWGGWGQQQPKPEPVKPTSAWDNWGKPETSNKWDNWGEPESDDQWGHTQTSNQTDNWGEPEPAGHGWGQPAQTNQWGLQPSSNQHGGGRSGWGDSDRYDPWGGQQSGWGQPDNSWNSQTTTTYSYSNDGTNWNTTTNRTNDHGRGGNSNNNPLTGGLGLRRRF